MKNYSLYIKSGCSLPDYEDSCKAESKDEAADRFLERSPVTLREFDKDMLMEHICEEPEAVKTDMF